MDTLGGFASLPSECLNNDTSLRVRSESADNVEQCVRATEVSYSSGQSVEKAKVHYYNGDP